VRWVEGEKVRGEYKGGSIGFEFVREGEGEGKVGV